MKAVALALSLALAAPGIAAGQARPSASPAPEQEPPAGEPAAETPEPDISITATVRWKSLRFEAVGTPRVEFKGGEGPRNFWEAERINLPRPVQPGVTYRDGAVHLRVGASLVEIIDAALAEARADKVSLPAVPPGTPP